MASPSFETTDIALVAENSVPLYVPPPLSQDDQFVEDLIARGPLSPRTAQAALKNHGPGLSPEVALNLAKKVAQMALNKAHNTELRLNRMARSNQQALVAQQVALASADAALEAMRARLAELEGNNNDDHVEQECPDGFEENAGRVPDFFVKVDGVNLQARYVRRLPGTGLVQGTLGGPNDRIHLHELYAQPSIARKTTPDIVPTWFLQAIAANATLYAHVIDEIRKYGNWGLEAEVERYHNNDTRLVELQAEMREIQAEIDSCTIQKHACHYRLARADVGERFASLQATGAAYQSGEYECTAYPRNRKFGRGRPTA